MARGSDKGRRSKRDRGDPPRKGGAPKGPLDEEPREEVSAKQAFVLSFLVLSIILAPITGLGLYFGRNVEFVHNLFSTSEATFLGGMAIGVATAFVVSIIFTRKAVAQA